MIDGLIPYPSTRQACTGWLGEIPSHWEVLRAKFLFREADERSMDGSETHLSMSQKLGLVPSSMVKRTLISESYAGGRLCKPGDLVLNRLKAHLGVFAEAKHTGVVSPDYTVLRPHAGLATRYFEAVLRSPNCRSELRTRAKGIVEGFWRLYTDDFYQVRLPVPPLDEQRAIVKFLNHLDRKIRRYIREKQKLIKLLEEQNQAIIHQAVTRGLDSTVPLKPSGVEWLGDIPAHWEVVLNQRILKEEIRPHQGRSETQLSLSQRSGLLPTTEMQERSLQTSSFDNWKVTVPGDLVLNRFKAHLGVFFASNLRGIVSFHYGVFSPRRPLETKYFELLYHTYVYRAIYAGRSNGMTVGLQNLSNQNFYNVRSIVPPAEEQTAIIRFVESATEKREQAIQSGRWEIKLLREYHARLTADVVTGKLDVRDAVAGFRDEPADAESAALAEDEGDCEGTTDGELPDDEDVA